MKRILFLLGSCFSISVFSQEADSAKSSKDIEEIVMTGTLKAVSRDKSPVPVEVFSAKFFEKNPTPSIMESVEMINGVRPQLNCSVCNTGDIHINGLEGPYTLILIDGMPIVSSLSTVYGLNGIPNSMIERVEVVKGPASSLYGSEAMGGIINIITKNALTAPRLTLNLNSTSWGEHNTDIGGKFRLNDKVSSLLSLNYFNFQNKIDKNKDNFTDAALQNRISVFNKWDFQRNEGRVASLALRYFNEDRFGGVLEWEKKHRGSDEVYGESIYTKRFETIGIYQLPIKEKVVTQFSYNYHHQDSFYGDVPYLAKQSTAFGQIYWDKTLGKSDFLLGATVKNVYYDDNTPGTLSKDGTTNQPQNDWLPGIFAQNQWNINDKNTLLVGYRLDWSKVHGAIHSPRVAYKWSLASQTNLRASFGTGFRVVNLFTEDHAALTGSREVVISEALNPERSYNGNLNLTHKIYTSGGYINFDMIGFYSHFTNKIIGDFDTNSNQIIYQNLRGYAVSKGVSLNTELKLGSPLTVNLGASYMEVYQKYEEGGQTETLPQVFAPRWSGTYAISYNFPKEWSADFTGAFYGPMRLPVLPDDFRPAHSPWYTLANIQIRKHFSKLGIEVYGGVKNLFNFTPKNPIMRPFDPFDTKVSEPSNPYGYTFDTEYGYAPMLGIRGFVGLRYNIK